MKTVIEPAPAKYVENRPAGIGPRSRGPSARRGRGYPLSPPRGPGRKSAKLSPSGTRPKPSRAISLGREICRARVRAAVRGRPDDEGLDRRSLHPGRPGDGLRPGGQVDLGDAGLLDDLPAADERPKLVVGIVVDEIEFPPALGGSSPSSVFHWSRAPRMVPMTDEVSPPSVTQMTTSPRRIPGPGAGAGR